MNVAGKVLEKFVASSAARVWPLMQRLNQLGPDAKPFHPKWSDTPIPRATERTKPPLGWPRETDSLCPKCVKEARSEILRGDADWTKLISEKPGEIKASIVERNGSVLMEKTCPVSVTHCLRQPASREFLRW